MEEKINEEYDSAAKRAERALKIIKITVFITAVCAVALPAVSLVLLLVLDKAIYGLVGLIVSLCVFVVMLGVLVCGILYARKQVRKLKSFENEANK